MLALLEKIIVLCAFCRLSGKATDVPSSVPSLVPSSSSPTIYIAPGGLFCDAILFDVVAGTGSSGTVNGVGTSAQFNNLVGISVSPDRTYALIADWRNKVIRKMVLSTDAVTLFAGNSVGDDLDGIGTSAAFNYPWEIEISSDGLFALCLTEKHNLRHIVISTAAVTRLVGRGSNGYQDGVGTNAMFGFPKSVKLSKDNAFAVIADHGNHRIRKVVMSTMQVTTLAGQGTGYADGVGTLAQFALPYFMYFSSDDTFVLISEFNNHCIRKMIMSTAQVTTLAGSGSSGSSDGIGTLASFKVPAGLLLSSDDVFAYIADKDNSLIRLLQLSTRQVQTLPQSSTIGVPLSLSWLQQDSVFLVSSYSLHRIVKVYGDCAAPTSAPSISPLPTTIPTSNPTLYTAENGLFCNSLTLALFAGSTAPGASDGIGTMATLSDPNGIASSSDGSFILLVSYGNRIRKVNMMSRAVTTLAGSTTGSSNGIGTLAQFQGTSGISMAWDDTFAVSTCQGGHRIRKIVVSTAAVTTIGGNGVAGSVDGDSSMSTFNKPVGISLSSDASFALVVQNSECKVRRIEISTMVTTTLAGSGVGGGSNGIGTLASFSSLRGVAISHDDSFALVTEASGRVRKLVLSTLEVTHLAGRGTNSLLDGVGPVADFKNPQHIIITRDDSTAYVADYANAKIRRIELSVGLVTTLVAGASSSAALSHPFGLSFASQTDDSVLLVGDSRALLMYYGRCESPTAVPTTSVPTMSFAPTSLPTGNPSGEPSGAPTCIPSVIPSASPTSLPTEIPTGEPSGEPSRAPTCIPSVVPSASPTSLPTEIPTGEPSGEPSGAPTCIPSVIPSASPTSLPTEPSGEPSGAPTCIPSVVPSASPTSLPTEIPTGEPTTDPSSCPSVTPTDVPSADPTALPTQIPFSEPSALPSAVPSDKPTASPTKMPSHTPSAAPSVQPSDLPSKRPTRSPTGCPTRRPSRQPTMQPTAVPTQQPSVVPTGKPFPDSTFPPSRKPTGSPTRRPTSFPTISPTLSSEGLWSIHYDEVIVGVLPVDKNPSNMLLYSELAVESSIVRGGCNDWSVFVSSLSQLNLSPKKVANITFYQVDDLLESAVDAEAISCMSEWLLGGEYRGRAVCFQLWRDIVCFMRRSPVAV
jgi:hypothetical protein